MPLYEFRLVRRSGTTETRFSDRGARVGDRVVIDVRAFRVERALAPSSRLASHGLLCVELGTATEVTRRRAA